MKKTAALLLATGIAFSTFQMPSPMTPSPITAQAKTIEDGHYEVQMKPYYNGEISSFTTANLKQTVDVVVKNGVQTVTFTILNSQFVKKVSDETGQTIPSVKQQGTVSDFSVTGRQLIENGVNATLQIVVPEVPGYNHDYPIHFVFDRATLVSLDAKKTVRTLTGTVKNNVGKKDAVTVKGVKKGDTVRIYAGNNVIAKTKAKATTVTLNVNQLGKKAGKIAITAQAVSERESAKKVVSYKAEAVTPALKAANISVKNKKGTKNDRITVRSVKKGDVVRAYDTLGNVIGKTTAKSSTVTLKTKDLKKKGGTIYVNRTQTGKNASAKVKKTYKAEK